MNTVSLLWKNRSSEFTILTLSSILAFVIFLVRVSISGNKYFLFLSWNLFLAWIPYLIAFWLVRRTDRSKWVVAAGITGWLLFFPNSPYILTDLFHLRPRNASPLWLDLIVLLSFAWTGLLLGMSSLRKIQLAYFDRLGHVWGRVITVFILFLTSFGVYLGRYLRWNSWDILSNPLGLLNDIVMRIIHPLEYSRSTGFTVIFGVFLLMAYLTYIVRNPESPVS
ncbi:MAG: DUF1361 domain-containing protein [Bacteroidia bacterium]|nr:DUF1361 domain-containing protein [Bacteroidia bacterium]